MFTNEDDDVAYESPVPHDDVPVKEGISSPYARASSHTNRGDIVHGCHVRNVHRFAHAFGRLLLDDEKDAQGADWKARENAHADAHSASTQTLIEGETPQQKTTIFWRGC